ncbi:MAG: glycoside hydrolase family 99-like domain-containing protein [Clostridia bacterium]|nr:glycoside hydrolase family 99-like domain-containing protein [Clostridia bacterium]
MKIIAMHLPQFHRIPENDKWWGTGFTEWVNVRNSKPVFEGHNQPRVPYNEYYYDLTDREARVWQAQLAKKYGIYGFCYYHYWFNGKKLLEKPIEALLEDKEPDFPFCLSWANEPWSRAWEGKETQVLMPQVYGAEPEWKEHIDYLIKFFKDPRYIKIDNKPVFLIYRTSSIPDLDRMIELWTKEVKNSGLQGIYLIETLNSFQKVSNTELSDAVMEFEPMFTIKHEISPAAKIKRLLNKKTGQPDILDFNSIWNIILKRRNVYGKKTIFRGAFSGWDNSPRKGKKATILKHGSPGKFGHYLRQLAQQKTRININEDYIFINAWNEWAEGAYLEPDCSTGFAYLEEIKRLVNETNTGKEGKIHGYLSSNSYI